MPKLFIVEGKKTRVLDQRGFDNEKLLQNVVERFPEVIDLGDLGIREPFIVIGCEVYTLAGYIDVLCIDGNGVLTVIETKLARNSPIRREVVGQLVVGQLVVGQLLEYVAQLSKWQADDVERVANDYFVSKGVKIGERTATLKDLLVMEQFEELDPIPMNIRDKIENNLRKGIIKLVIASDSIPETLKDTVTFINNFSKFDMYVLQIRTYQDNQVQIYAPTVSGFVSKSNESVSSDRDRWDEERFLESLVELVPEEAEVIRKLYKFSQLNATIRWGTGKISPSYGHNVDFKKKKVNIFMFNHDYKTARIGIYFGSMKGIIPDEKLHAFRKSLNQLPGVELKEHAVDVKKFPSIKVESVIKPENFFRFTEEVLRLHETAIKH